MTFIDYLSGLKPVPRDVKYSYHPIFCDSLLVLTIISILSFK